MLDIIPNIASLGNWKIISRQPVINTAAALGNVTCIQDNSGRVKFQNNNSTVTVLGTCISQYCMSVCGITFIIFNIFWLSKC